MSKYCVAMLCLVFAAQIAGADEIKLLDPVRLKAGDQYIDTGKQVGHSGPVTIDFDKDGKTDLLVGSFSGKIRFFRNKGGNGSPVYEDKGFLEAEGETIEINNW